MVNPSEEQKRGWNWALLLFQIQLHLSAQYFQVSSKIWCLFSGYVMMGWPVLLSLLHSELFPILKEVAYKACALRPAVCYLADLVWSLKGKKHSAVIQSLLEIHLLDWNCFLLCGFLNAANAVLFHFTSV